MQKRAEIAATQMKLESLSLEQQALELGWRHLKPHHLDEIFLAVADEDVALVVEVCCITRVIEIVDQCLLMRVTWHWGHRGLTSKDRTTQGLK